MYIIYIYEIYVYIIYYQFYIPQKNFFSFFEYFPLYKSLEKYYKKFLWLYINSFLKTRFLSQYFHENMPIKYYSRFLRVDNLPNYSLRASKTLQYYAIIFCVIIFSFIYV